MASAQASTLTSLAPSPWQAPGMSSGLFLLGPAPVPEPVKHQHQREKRRQQHHQHRLQHQQPVLLLQQHKTTSSRHPMQDETLLHLACEPRKADLVGPCKVFPHVPRQQMLTQHPLKRPRPMPVWSHTWQQPPACRQQHETREPPKKRQWTEDSPEEVDHSKRSKRERSALKEESTICASTVFPYVLWRTKSPCESDAESVGDSDDAFDASGPSSSLSEATSQVPEKVSSRRQASSNLKHLSQNKDFDQVSVNREGLTDSQQAVPAWLIAALEFLDEL